jgi:predicted PolB exonuclease-like 3'-5' exonuclease|tara:strand:- start:2546 stop:3175 length:630 start_codon:yes stop_codon:yes gene_type:complete
LSGKKVNGVYDVSKITSLTGSEESILKKFSRTIDFNPKVITWNGRGFDLPVLTHRAYVKGIRLQGWFGAGDKWNCYTQRYSEAWHCDLMDTMSAYGATKRLKLDTVASAIGLPGKVGVDGADVGSLYEDGKIEEITDYCETDVVSTYCCYLRWKLVEGKLTEKAYQESINSLLNYVSYRYGNTEDSYFLDYMKHVEVDKLGLKNVSIIN